MKPDKRTLILPLLLIAVGVGWLLTTLGVAPGIDWVWTLGLAIVGLLTFAIGGIDKVSVVIGPFFILASMLSILRQTGRLRLRCGGSHPGDLLQACCSWSPGCRRYRLHDGSLKTQTRNHETGRVDQSGKSGRMEEHCSSPTA